MQEIIELAKTDREKHLKYGVDINPFSTPSARCEWQEGYNDSELQKNNFSRYYLRGYCAGLLEDDKF